MPNITKEEIKKRISYINGNYVEVVSPTDLSQYLSELEERIKGLENQSMIDMAKGVTDYATGKLPEKSQENWEKKFDDETRGIDEVFTPFLKEIKNFIRQTLQSQKENLIKDIEDWAKKTQIKGDTKFNEGVNAGMRYLIKFLSILKKHK